MKDASIERVEKDTEGWGYRDELPEKAYGFSLDRRTEIHGDKYDLFSYENSEAHLSAAAYFHEETKEYKFRVKIGLTEFCRIEFIAPNIETFESLLKAHLMEVLHDMVEFNPDTLNNLVKEKHITEWDYKELLPDILEGFELYIRPEAPVVVLNGSVIVFDYSDFKNESNFVIYYNMFRDEFYGEARINNLPDMTYAFDSAELPELEEKLSVLLVPRLQEIRSRMHNG